MPPELDGRSFRQAHGHIECSDSTVQIIRVPAAVGLARVPSPRQHAKAPAEVVADAFYLGRRIGRRDAEVSDSKIMSRP